jgi:hypothetical protein
MDGCFKQLSQSERFDFLCQTKLQQSYVFRVNFSFKPRQIKSDSFYVDWCSTQQIAVAVFSVLFRDLGSNTQNFDR